MNDLDEFYSITTEELNNFLEHVDQGAMRRAADLILDSEKENGRVHVTGIGKPSYVAGYAASLLSSTGTKTYFLDGTEAVHGSAGQVAPGDVVIAISNSGQTLELRSTIETLQRNGAHIIAITGNSESWLAQHAEVTLIAGVKREGDDLNKPPRASILAEMLMIQGLSILLQTECQLTPQDYVKWHPGGALGASITHKELG